MPVSALLLALAAAFLHAFWNLLLAGAEQSEAVAAVMLVTGVVVFAPVAAATWDVEWRAAPYIAGSAILQLIYFALLVAAYRGSELSLVYPLARGLAPVIVLGVTVIALGASLSAGEAAGVVVVGIGVILVRGLRRPADGRGVLLGILLAACIAAYTVVDSEGLQYAEPISYFELVLIGTTIAYLAIAIRLVGVRPIVSELRPRAFAAGIAAFAAYALVLAALERASAASVAAVRETSIVLATALAAIFLRESVGGTRAVGAVAVVGGVALIALS
jgi:drug/metabolite transporter (DMT)-like permease